MRKKERVIISVGGSIVVPETPDAKFLKGLRKLIKSYSNKFRFVLIIGGGKTCRHYHKAAKGVINMKDIDLDWLGIHTTWLNAYLVKTIFKDIAYKDVIINPTKKINFDKVAVAGGWRPGCSTDYDAVLLARNVGAKTVINMTNVDYLHDKDPRKYKTAKKIENISWKGFRKIVGDKWNPGMNAPFDPIASKMAQRLDMRLVLLGNKLDNLKKYLDGKKFKGSVVEG